MTDKEIQNAVGIMKQRALNVAPLSMSAEGHIGLIELIIDCEAILRGFQPGRPRQEIERDLKEALK